MKLHAFIAMPFGTKNGADGQPIDFNRVYAEYLKPGLEAAGLEVFRADEEPAAGDIRSDMFQELLIADLVVADLTIDNPNVWYELGVRHALRSRGVLLVSGPRERPVFDTVTDRKLHYHLKNGVPDADFLQADIAALAAMARATLESWHGRKISPVYRLVENLQEPDWKELKVGDAREFWQTHEAWAQQVRRAQRSGRPGDVLVLAEETPVVALRSDARFAAGEALLKLQRYAFALEQYEACLAVDPAHRKAGYKKGVCLQRLGKLDDAREHYRALLKASPKDAELWALLGRVDKDAWVAAWRLEGSSMQRMRDDAAYEDALLKAAIASYRDGFRADAGHYYSGINAATLIHLYRHLTGSDEHAKELPALEGGVRWSAWAAQDRARDNNETDYWAAATLGDLALLTGTPAEVQSAYKEAIRLVEQDWFSLNSTLDAIRLLQQLEFRPEAVAAAINTFERAMSRLNPPSTTTGQGWQPRRVVLFTGHLVDAPGRTPPRFPESAVPRAAERIAAALDELEAGPEDLALTQGAAGGDLLFSEAALARGMKLRWLQPFAEPQFLQQSVSARGEAWLKRYDALRGRLDAEQPLLAAPEALGEPRAGIDAFERCNQWLLATGLAHGLDKLRLIALWDGAAGDGPGGTQHMVQVVRSRTGRAVIIDPATLG
ncbi:MAG: DUF4071 domain-containing protein [Burkholderiaceae bacterium]|nr:DUF4071 domain-containing protein [Burkholderiaceae bacterium]